MILPAARYDGVPVNTYNGHAVCNLCIFEEATIYLVLRLGREMEAIESVVLDKPSET